MEKQRNYTINTPRYIQMFNSKIKVNFFFSSTSICIYLCLVLFSIFFSCKGLSTEDISNGSFLPSAGEQPHIVVMQDDKNYALGSIYEFDKQENDTSSNEVTFTIKNTGIQTLKFEGNPKIHLTGDDASMFTITQPSKPQLEQNETDTFTIKFTPLKSGGIGKKNATLEIETNDPFNSKFVLSFLGESINTILAADISAGVDISSPSNFYVYHNKLYFSAQNGYYQKLWVYDEVNGASLLADIGPYENDPINFVEYNGKLYFQAMDGSFNPYHGKELWRYDDALPVIDNGGDGYSQCTGDDSTTDNPCMVANIQSDFNDSLPAYLTVYNNKLYFSANDGTNGTELWMYDDSNTTINPGIDCSSNNPCMVKDIWTTTSSSSPRYLIVFDSKLYFSATDGSNGTELWMYDGTDNPALGTNIKMVEDIYNGSTGSYPQYFTILGNKLYFTAKKDEDIGKELMVYDGTNVSLVADIYIGLNKNASPQYTVAFDDKICFKAQTSDGEFWIYDTTKNIDMTNGDSTKYDVCSSGDNPCMIDINNGLINNSNPSGFTPFANKLYFQANDGIHGAELWRYNP